MKEAGECWKNDAGCAFLYRPDHVGWNGNSEFGGWIGTIFVAHLPSRVPLRAFHLAQHVTPPYKPDEVEKGVINRVDIVPPRV
jgi:hypothetical protein